MKKLFLVLLAICSVNVAGQNKTFFDDFNELTPVWKLLSKHAKISVKNSQLFLELISNSGKNIPKQEILVYDKLIELNKDFELSTKLIDGRKKGSSSISRGMGIVWDFVDDNNYLTTGIWGNTFSITRYLNGKQIHFFKKNITNYDKNKKEFHTLKIKNVGGVLSFFIDNIKLHSSEIKLYNEKSYIGLFYQGINEWGYKRYDFKEYNYSLRVDNFILKHSENDDTNYQITKKVKKNNFTEKTPPSITITSPNVNRGFSIVKNNKRTTISGTIADESKIYEVLINGQDAYVDSNGKFSKNVILGIGENSFTVKATDVHMNSTTKTFTIKREVEQTETTITNTTKINNTNSIETGKYYALIIGNNEYTDSAISTLDEPIKDATKLYNVLTSKYSFSPQNVTLLKNATYVQMIDAFDKLSNTLTKNDNLLVFYAGHGWWDKKKNLGYWLPSNAKQSSTAFWIRNSTISDYMASIKSKHTLLIADACFSGSIFKTRSAFDNAPIAIKKLNNLPSKTAMTSGNLMEVPDKSVFLKYLVQRLEENTDKYLPADKLFASFRIAVMNNSPNAPQFGTIQNAGDEGGEFIFVKRN